MYLVLECISFMVFFGPQISVLWSLRLIDDGYNNNVWLLVFVLINLLLIVCVFDCGLLVACGFWLFWLLNALLWLIDGD